MASPLERKFWEQKRDIALQNHRDEMARMGTTGTSMNRLAAYVRDLERAERKLAKSRG
jgi:hypothetical protein